MTIYRIVLVAVLIPLCGLSPAALDMHQHQHDSGERLGKVSFPVSCANVQAQFNRAVALLHSFWYEEAEKAFSEIASKEPGCAMAYWGIAISNYHPVWAPPTPTELGKGRAAVAKAISVGGQDERENDYIKALEVFYKDADKLDHR